MKILSIDPGYDRCGVAVLEKGEGGKESLVFSDCIKTNNKDDFSKRLFQIGKRLEEIIEEYSPSVVAVEKLFFNTNQKTAMNVSQVRGMIIYVGEKSGLNVLEYTPLQIKIAITGYGRSDKSQVTKMVPNLIKVEKEIKLDDEWDAIAVGLTCFASEKF